jgi:hypothetical protein
VRHEIAKLKQQLQQNWLLDYERDIQSWLDQEITLAVTDIDLDAQPTNGLQTGYLLAFAAKDAELAKTSIDAFWQRLAVNGSDLGFEQYQGISILSTSFVEDKPAIAGTTLDQFVLFANDARVLRKAIDAMQKPDLSLASLSNYRDRLAQLSTGKNTGKVSVAYVNLAEFGEELPKESLLMGLSFDNSGIKVKTALTLATASDKTETAIALPETKLKTTKKSSGNIANAIPSGSSVVIGNNLTQTWQGLQNTMLPEWKQALIKSIAPIPMDDNAFAWAQQDYAIALFPKSSSDPDWLVVAKVEDANGAKEALSSLDDMARNKLTVGEISLKSQPVTIWTKLSASDNFAVSGNVAAAHTQTKDYVYLSNSLPILESALTLKNNDSIAASKSFKTILAKLPSDRFTYAYLDKNLDLSWLQTSILNLKVTSGISENTSNFLLAQILEHVQVSGFASTSSGAIMQNSELSLILK